MEQNRVHARVALATGDRSRECLGNALCERLWFDPDHLGRAIARDELTGSLGASFSDLPRSCLQVRGSTGTSLDRVDGQARGGGIDRDVALERLLGSLGRAVFPDHGGGGEAGEHDTEDEAIDQAVRGLVRRVWSCAADVSMMGATVVVVISKSGTEATVMPSAAEAASGSLSSALMRLRTP